VGGPLMMIIIMRRELYHGMLVLYSVCVQVVFVDSGRR
jgi:hypothetical protein